MKKTGIITLIILVCVVLCASWASAVEEAAKPEANEQINILGKQDIVVKRGYLPEAKKCVECHARKTPGIVADWKNGRMAHASVSCYDCHVVEKTSPMASQCEGIEGTGIYISPMVSSKSCERCHPVEVEEFLKSGHAFLAGAPVIDKAKFQKLMYTLEGGKFMGGKASDAARSSGCQMCHGTKVELDENNKPIKQTWPGGVGTRYPDGSIGNCTVCHTRHRFSVAEARKPDACASCHLGPDHPDIEIYENSKHGQIYAAEGEEWNWDAAPGTWQPGDYRAPTCAACHMSGIGELKTTHNINDRLTWDLMHKVSVIRSGERGDGEKGRKLMLQVCKACHGSTQTAASMDTLDNAVALYNEYYNNAQVMKATLKEKNLLKLDDPWADGFLELDYYLWHHVGRRARQGAAMNGPDYAHWHGFFQIFQVYKDMKQIHDNRLKTGKIEELSTVMSSAPL